ncbi:hypothetical protein LguiB_008091 [Lonicera macranthoides]
MEVTREDYVYRAKLSMALHRHDESVKMMEKLISILDPPLDLTAAEREILIRSFSSVLGHLQQCWIELTAIKDEEHVAIIEEYKHTVKKDMKDACGRFFNLIDHRLTSETAAAARVDYLKMKADMCRFLCQYLEGRKLEKMMKKAKQAYSDAQELAKKNLDPKDPTRLRLSLNYAGFYLNVMDNAASASYVATKAIEDAGHVDDEEYPEASLILTDLKNLYISLYSEQENNNWLPV